MRRQVHLLPMRLQVRVVQDSPDSTIAGVDSLGANVATEQRCGPMRHGDADVLRRPASLSLDAGCIGVGEREIGRPERGASVSFKAGLSLLANRAFQRDTVRTCTPSSLAMSPAPTPSAINSRASALFSTRDSVFAGRMAASTCARCSGASGNGVARGPGWARVTHGSASIMRCTYRSLQRLAKFLPSGTRRRSDQNVTAVGEDRAVESVGALSP